MPRPIPVNVGSSASSVATCVNANTKTRSKKSSRGVTLCSTSTAATLIGRDTTAGLSESLDKCEDALPGVLGGLGVLLLLAVEEAVRRALIGDELVLDARGLERTVELLYVLRADRLVGAAHQAQDRRIDLGGPLRRARRAVRADAGPPVEADGTGQVVARGRCEPGVAPAETEADREHRPARFRRRRAQVRHACADVGLDAVWGGLIDVLAVREVVGPLADPGRPPEVVDRDRRVAALGEAKRELLVEAVEPPHIGQDHDADAKRLVGGCGERGELRSVGGL